MRALIPIVLALACPIGMCVVPMLLMRRRGASHADQVGSEELTGLRSEVTALRSQLAERQETEA